jgi:hypothetical protein
MCGSPTFEMEDLMQSGNGDIIFFSQLARIFASRISSADFFIAMRLDFVIARDGFVRGRTPIVEPIEDGNGQY